MKLLSLTSYLSLTWALFVSFCLAPGEAFSQTATQYSRVVAQAERIAYLAGMIDDPNSKSHEPTPEEELAAAIAATKAKEAK